MGLRLEPSAPLLDDDAIAAIKTGELRLLDPDARTSPQVVDALLAPDFVEFGSSGRVFDRPATLAGLEAEAGSPEQVTREVRDFTIRPLARDAALVTYTVLRRLAGKPVAASLRSSVWTRMGDGWRMRFHQGTPLVAATAIPDAATLVGAGYDAMADAYLARCGRSSIRDGKLADVMASLPAAASVLDLGCGSGLPVAKALAEAGHDVTGIDASAVQIEWARRNVPQARFVHGDISEARFPAGSFDAVVAFYVMNHVPRNHQATLLAHIASWLRPGGLFLGSFGTEDGDWTGEWLGVPMRFSHLPPERTRALIEEVGLTTITAEVLQQDNEATSFLWITARR